MKQKGHEYGFFMCKFEFLFCYNTILCKINEFFNTKNICYYKNREVKRGVKSGKHTCNFECQNRNFCYNPKPIFCPTSYCGKNQKFYYKSRQF